MDEDESAIPAGVSPELRAIVETFNPDCEMFETLIELREKLVRIGAETNCRFARMMERYCASKVYAMEVRLAGGCGDASHYERECDEIYRLMPAWMRW